MSNTKSLAKPIGKRATPALKKTPAAKKAPSSAAPAAPVAVSKHKLVRDSFTIPKPEYLVLENLKLRAASLARPVKKSELLRAGIKALEAMSDRSLLAALNGVPSLKTGRPKGADEAPAARKSRK